MDRWTANEAPVPAAAVDLESGIRPWLLAIGEAILAEIAAALEDGGAFADPDLERFAGPAEVDCRWPVARNAIHRGLVDLRRR